MSGIQSHEKVISVSDWISLIESRITLLWSMQMNYTSLFTGLMLVIPTLLVIKFPEHAFPSMSINETKWFILIIYISIIIFVIIFARSVSNKILGDIISLRRKYEQLQKQLLSNKLTDTEIIYTEFMKISLLKGV